MTLIMLSTNSGKPSNKSNFLHVWKSHQQEFIVKIPCFHCFRDSIESYFEVNFEECVFVCYACGRILNFNSFIHSSLIEMHLNFNEIVWTISFEKYFDEKEKSDA